ncbi:hypothetical protein BC962_1658 [Gillisia mitskevichiae]|uniref:Uncharacterized protein n=1 Tax=Gillisia mitskevichiae TaxID=270921 RepID=A0A495PVA9_9FLAO|nr:hypothetical protein [Gillisia mitskevichiae]RKS53408.1 hypothetical protein BC962_1658 [Gillisia mitskevichiae]
MKKLTLTLVGIFAFSYGFSNNSIENSKSIENVDCVKFTLSCGIGGLACNLDTFEQLMNEIYYFEDELC